MEAFQQQFIDEVKELISEMEADLLIFEKNPQNFDALENIQRVMHTLKGSSSMFGFDNIVEITHRLESLFKKIKNNEIEANKEIIDLTFATVDIIEKILNDKNLDNQEIANKYYSTLKKINSYFDEKELEGKTNAQNNIDFALYYITFEPDSDFEERGVNLRTIFKEIDEIGKAKILPKTRVEEDKYNLCWDIFIASNKDIDDIEEIFMFVELETEIEQISDENLLLNKQFLNKINEISKKDELIGIENVKKIIKEHNTEKQKIEKQEELIPKIRAKKKLSLRIEADKLDDIMNTVSELITLKSKIHLFAETKASQELLELTEELEKLTTSLKDEMFGIRLIPLESIKMQFERLVRDTANKLNKNVKLLTNNLNIELDKTIIEGVSVPILHIIRNSIDHGIEYPDIRKTKGKPEKGTITISAEQTGAFVFISISDDGAGINKNKIREIAISKQLIKTEDKLTDNELYNLIFTPGFSTSQHLTEISGRGIGMDIVHNEIEKLRGSIIVESEKDIGTTIKLRIPISISIIDTILVQTGDMFFAIPAEEIIQCQIANDDKFSQNGNHYFKYNQTLIPFVNLSETLNIKTKTKQKLKAVVVKNNEKPKAIIVDKIIGGYQAIVKPINNIFKNKEFIAGGSILPSGNIAYILDTEKLNLN